MSRRTLEQNIEAGELTVANVGVILNVSTPTARKMIARLGIKTRNLFLTQEIRVNPKSLLDRVKELDIAFHPCLITAAENTIKADLDTSIDSNGAKKPVVMALSNPPQKQIKEPVKPASPAPKEKITKTSKEPKPGDVMSLPLDEFSG